MSIESDKLTGFSVLHHPPMFTFVFYVLILFFGLKIKRFANFVKKIKLLFENM